MSIWRCFTSYKNPDYYAIEWVWNTVEEQGYWFWPGDSKPKASNKSRLGLAGFLHDGWVEVPSPWEDKDPDLALDEGL